MARRTWSLGEIRILAERYPDEGPGPLAALLGRSEDSVTAAARRFGLRSANRRRRQGTTRAAGSLTVDPSFFEAPSEVVAYVLGVIWAWGSIKVTTRKVLRLRCPVGRERTLLSILDLIGSRHSLQRGRRRILVEVGNSLLVASLVHRFGRPPGRKDPGPRIPTILPEHVPHFARGFLDASGDLRPGRILFSGPPRTIDALGHLIATATGIRPTEIVDLGERRAVVWKGVVEVMTLGRWLPPRRV